jgi:HEAT repeat protein
MCRWTLPNRSKPLDAQTASAAFEAVEAALKNDNVNVRLAGAASIYGFIGRSNSAELLKRSLGTLNDLLNDPDARFSYAGVLGLANLRPVPPPQIVPLFLKFVQRTDYRNTVIQAGVISVLLDHVPDNPEVLAAIEQFASRTLEPQTRITLLGSIGLVPRHNDRLVAIVIASMADPDDRVRERAVYNLTRLGRESIAKVALDLQRMTAADSDPRVRAAADKALRVMGGEDPYLP